MSSGVSSSFFYISFVSIHPLGWFSGRKGKKVINLASLGPEREEKAPRSFSFVLDAQRNNLPMKPIGPQILPPRHRGSLVGPRPTLVLKVVVVVVVVRKKRRKRK